MQVALKIWRYDAATGDKALREYEVDAPEEATLLDCLDIVKDRHDGSLAYRKSCRMMICGSCGMRMDGGAVLACKVRMYDIANAGHVPVISAMGNLPVIKDLVVDMDPFWAKFKAMKPYLQPGYNQPEDGKEHRISQERMNVIHKESLCINCGCCVSECNAMESDPEFLGPQALAKGMRFVGDPRDAAKAERLDEYSSEHGIWECTRCYFCNERCPKGVDPRDAIAKLGAEAMKEGIDDDMGAKHANWFVVSAKTTGWLRETELVPKTQGIVSSIKEMKFAMGLLKHGKVPVPIPPHVAEGVKESRALYDIVKSQDRQGAMGIVQGEHALSRLEHAGPDAAELPGEKEPPDVLKWGQADADKGARRVRKVAYYKGCLASLSREGARHLDPGAVSEGGAGAARARDGHLLRRRRHPRGRARLLPAPERAHPRLRRGDRVRHADDGLQRLHAQPAAGELPAAGRRGAARARQRQPGQGRRPAVHGQGRGAALPLARRGRRGLRAAPDRRAQGAQGPEDRALLRLPDPAPVEAARLRGSRQAVVARADHRGVRRRGDRLPGEDQVLRLPDHPGARGDGAGRADPADRAGEGGRRGRDRDAVPALPPLARRLADEAEEADRARTSRCRSCISRS